MHLLLLGLLALPIQEKAWQRPVPQGEIGRFDLSLLERDEGDAFFAVFADTHAETQRPPYALDSLDDPRLDYRRTTRALTNNARFDRVVRQINALDVDFSVHLGDIVTSMPFGVTFDEESTVALEILDQLEAPFHLAPGNHDVGNKRTMPFADKPPMRMYVCEENEELYRSHFGEPFFSWDHGDDHYIVLNTMVFNTGLEDDLAQWSWLEADLEASRDARHTFMFGHVALFWHTPADIGPNNYEVIDEPARSRLLDLIERYEVEAVFTGHTHHMFRARYGETQLITAPSTAFTRNTWRIYPELPPRTMAAPKLGYFLVRAGEQASVTNYVRIRDELPAARTAQAGVLPEPARVVTPQSREATGSSLLLEAPVPRHVRAAWQVQGLNDGRLRQQPGFGDGRHGWRTFFGEGAFEYPQHVQVELRETETIHALRLHASLIEVDHAIESSLDGEAWTVLAEVPGDDEALGPGSAERPHRFAPHEARFVRVVFTEPALPESGSFKQVRIEELEVLDGAGRNVAWAKEGAVASSEAYGQTPRETVRDHAWLAAQDICNRLLRVASEGASAWDAVEFRAGAYQLDPDLRRAVANGPKEGFELVLPLSVRHPEHVAGDLAAFRAYCDFMVDQLGDSVAVWELALTERDAITGAILGYACPTPEFLTKVDVMIDSVRARVSTARFAVSGLALVDPESLDEVLSQLPADVELVSLLPPPDRLSLEAPTVLELVDALGPIREAHPERQLVLELRPLELAGLPALGASRLARSLVELRSLGVMPGARLDGTRGLLNPVDDPYDAFYAVRLLAILLDADATPVKPAAIRLKGRDLEQYVFRRADGSWLVIAWLTAAVEFRRAELRLPAGLRATAYDLSSGTSQELRIKTTEEGRAAPGVLIREHPTAILIRPE